MKKVLSLVLAVSFMLSVTAVNSFAVSSEYLAAEEERIGYARLVDASFGTDDRVQIRKDILMLQEKGVLSSAAEELVSIEESGGKLCYTIKVDSYVDDIYVIKNTDYQVELLVKEGPLSNTVVFEEDVITINGKAIAVSTKAPLSEREDRNELSRNSVTDYVTVCPYGVAGDYNRHVGDSPLREIEMQETFARLTLSAFVIALRLLGGTNIAGVAYDLGELALETGSTLLSWLKLYSADKSTLLYLSKMYYHYTSGSFSAGYISGYGAYVIRCHETVRATLNSPSKETEKYRVHTIY